MLVRVGVLMGVSGSVGVGVKVAPDSRFDPQLDNKIIIMTRRAVMLFPVFIFAPMLLQLILYY